MGDYATQVAVVTGAGSGIGRAVAIALAARGADLALADRDGDGLAATAGRCHKVRLRTATVDVTDREAVAGFAAAVRDDFGRVDLVFAAAGVIHVGSLLESEFADISAVIETNLFAVIHTARAFLPALIASGCGQLVTFSSGFGLMAAPHYSAYSASKFAVRGFSEALRQEMARDGHPVTVTCVYPGRIRTPIMRNGSYAAGENAEAIIARFDRSARMDAGQAAGVILRGVAAGRAQVLVGADARVVSLLIRVAGSRYQDLLPLLARRGRRKRHTAAE